MLLHPNAVAHPFASREYIAGYESRQLHGGKPVVPMQWSYNKRREWFKGWLDANADVAKNRIGQF